MSNRLTNLNTLYSKIFGYYKSQIFSALDAKRSDLEKILFQVLEKYAKNYSLVHLGSIEEKKYFQIKSRVKSPISLMEKLVRKNLGLKLINELAILKIDDLEKGETKALLQGKIKEVDDIIGVRIVTDLIVDNKSVHNLIQDKTSELESHGIKLDISPQPVPMKNGLPIFKIKGVFQNEICFELQIKSKIEEAWGEMDHSLFYKDYSFQPIKNTVALTMTNVGHLLEKIEFLLFDLRDSSRTYQESAAQLAFLNRLNDEFTKRVVEELKIPCDLTGISGLLRAIIRTLRIDETWKISVLSLSEIEFVPNNDLCVAFRKSRDLSHELLFIELFFISLKKDNGDEVTQENYDALIEELIECIFNNSKEGLLSDNPEDLILRVFEYIKELIIFFEPNIILDQKLHSELSKFLSKANNLEEALNEDVELNELLPEFIRILIILNFNGNLLKYIDINHIDLTSYEPIIEVISKSNELKDLRSLSDQLKLKISSL